MFRTGFKADCLTGQRARVAKGSDGRVRQRREERDQIVNHVLIVDNRVGRLLDQQNDKFAER